MIFLSKNKPPASSATVGVAAANDGTGTLTATLPAGDPTDIVIWGIVQKTSLHSTTNDLIATANANLRAVHRGGGAMRIQSSDGAGTTSTATPGNTGEDDWQIFIAKIECGVETVVASKDEAGSWSLISDTTDAPNLAFVDIGDEVITIGSTDYAFQVKRLGMAIGTTVDVTSGTVQAAMGAESGGVITPNSDPSVFQAFLSGGTILFDVYDGLNENDGTLTLTQSGSGWS